MRTWLAWAFLSPDRRLRLGWRLLLFGLMLVFIQGNIAFAVAMLLGPSPGLGGSLLDRLHPGAVAVEAVGLVSMTLAVYVARRWLDRRSFSSLGLALNRDAPRQLLVGALLGVGLQAFVFAVELAAGWLTVERLGWRGPFGVIEGLLGAAVVFLVVAWNEELLTRGYLFQNVEASLDTAVALVTTSLVFGALHIVNPNASIIAAVGVSFAGVLLAAAYLVTRSLWLPIGLHLGWNYGEGPIFGFPVSGLDAGGLITHHVSGPLLITGGAFGPEAGLISIAAELVGIAVLYAWWRRGAPTDANLR